MSGSDETPTAELLNLGPASARMLESIGVKTRADLARVGPVLAYRALCDIRTGVSLNLLYAMHGALTGERWDRLPETTRAELKREAEQALRVPPSAATSLTAPPDETPSRLASSGRHR